MVGVLLKSGKNTPKLTQLLYSHRTKKEGLTRTVSPVFYPVSRFLLPYASGASSEGICTSSELSASSA